MNDQQYYKLSNLLVCISVLMLCICIGIFMQRRGIKDAIFVVIWVSYLLWNMYSRRRFKNEMREHNYTMAVYRLEGKNEDFLFD